MLFGALTPVPQRTMCQMEVQIPCITGRESFFCGHVPTHCVYSDYAAIHYKIIRIFTDISWRVFDTLTEAVPYTFVFVNRRNDVPHCNENSPKNILRYTDMFAMYGVKVAYLRLSTRGHLQW